MGVAAFMAQLLTVHRMVAANEPLQISQAFAAAQDAQHHDKQRLPGGVRTPRRIRESGIALRKLIKSRSVAAESIPGKMTGFSTNPTHADSSGLSTYDT